MQVYMGLNARENLSLGFANNKGVDQPAHPRRLINAFAIGFLESIISKLATNDVSIFELVSVAEATGLNLAYPKTPKTVFIESNPILYV